MHHIRVYPMHDYDGVVVPDCRNQISCVCSNGSTVDIPSSLAQLANRNRVQRNYRLRCNVYYQHKQLNKQSDISKVSYIVVYTRLKLSGQVWSSQGYIYFCSLSLSLLHFCIHLLLVLIYLLFFSFFLSFSFLPQFI